MICEWSGILTIAVDESRSLGDLVLGGDWGFHVDGKGLHDASC